MNFKQFRFAYYSFFFILKLCIFLAVLLWIKNTFQYFENAKIFELFNPLNPNKIWEITKFWLITTAWFILKIIILNVVGWIIKNLPINSKWLAYWDNLGEIPPILGREITAYLRRHNTIGFMQLMFLHEYSNKQLNFLRIHSQNPNTQQLFKKYDLNYHKDISDLGNEKSDKQ